VLKEGLELRLEEARDDCVREALDNVIVLVGRRLLSTNIGGMNWVKH